MRAAVFTATPEVTHAAEINDTLTFVDGVENLLDASEVCWDKTVPTTWLRIGIGCRGSSSACCACRRRCMI
jgi:hypothetical protein